MLLFTVAEINADVFFKHPFNSLFRPKNLVEYTVMNIEQIDESERRRFKGQGAVSRKVLSYIHKCYILNESGLLWSTNSYTFPTCILKKGAPFSLPHPPASARSGRLLGDKDEPVGPERRRRNPLPDSLGTLVAARRPRLRVRPTKPIVIRVLFHVLHDFTSLA